MYGAYDAEDRQVSATVNSNTATYAYDGEGLRVSKTVSGQTTIFVYDAFGNLAAEYGTPTASPCGTTTCYLTTDHLGSTRLLTDNAGSSTNVKRYDFLPFGEEIVAPVNGRSTSMGYPSSPDAFLEKFTGHARDTETANINSMTGLDWMRARYYSSSQGRFQSVDPANVGASVGDPQSWNGYAYVGNNPLNYRDPSGMFGEGASVGCAGGPVGCTIGLAADIICAIFCADIFRGGSGSSAAPKVMTGGGIGNSPEVWSERAPISGGGVNTGGVYGSGSAGGLIFSFQQAAVKSTSDLLRCAAANAGSIASLLKQAGAPSSVMDNWGVQALLGNDFSSISNVITDFDKSSLGQLAISSPFKWNLVNQSKELWGRTESKTAIKVLESTALDSVGNNIFYTRAAKVMETAAFKVGSKALGVFSAVKIAVDGGAYLWAVGRCGGYY